MASEGHSPCEEYSAAEEHGSGIPPIWADLSYQNRAPEINGFIEPEWVSPHSNFSTSVNPYVTPAHTTASMPTPISLADKPFLEPRQSPSQSHHDIPYREITDSTVHHGLGISGPSTTGYVQPGVFTFDHPHRQTLDNPFSPESQAGGFNPRPLNSATQPSASIARSSQGRGHVNIAPNPDGLLKMQHERRTSQSGETTQRRRSGSSRKTSGQRSRPSQMDRENDTVRSLRTERNLPWREIVSYTNAEFGTNYSASCLQMRMTRMRQRAQQWSEDDIRELRRAHDYWESAKFEIISQKMQEFGAGNFSASQCELKWQELKGDIHSEESDASEGPPRRRQRRS
ncbi:hypothetical protein AJ79_00854 [Helicocarpus griseus UAMH5409]|uniref:Myb-like domain-containing protein n=1 Tax=Helicocarpus griseus UAMH5409 TaxID=1447875 RepID=A0A2B7Y9M6_9EURO|nr:hypothetical protein AJ79_00854 [Helicocarpus griseus UAMH5409]